MHKPRSGFTIVELLVVIVVIGVLAAISLVSYSGITNQALIASVKSDLANSSNQLKNFNVDNGSYPTTVSTNCTTNPDTSTNKCLKLSGGNEIESYSANNATTPPTFVLAIKNGSSIVWEVTESTQPTVANSSWLTLGTQSWAKVNLDVGVMLASAATLPADNATVEKWCYNNDPANCTAFGGLYSWDEMMQYTTTEGAQGLCPAGSHIPTDNEWKTLEIYLGMTQVQADATGWRGTNQGTQLKPGGSSGMEIPFGGFRDIFSSFGNSTYSYLWSSSESGTNAWRRYLNTGFTSVNRGTYGKGYGLSVRCLKN